jgi:hypothetical protein
MRIVINLGVVALELSAESEPARRELGPVAWSVLEALAFTGQDIDGQWMATTNARDLARRLGIGKDRAAAALRTLRDAGLVVTTTSREASTSRFAASSYKVRVPVAEVAAVSIAELAPPPPRTARTRPPRRAQPPETLDLFSSTS